MFVCGGYLALVQMLGLGQPPMSMLVLKLYFKSYLITCGQLV